MGQEQGIRVAAMRLAVLLAAATGIAAVSGVSAAGVSGSPTRPSGTLQINTSIGQHWRMSDDFCPPGTPAGTDCLRSVGEGVITGLGRVTVTYYKLLPDEEGCFIIHNNTAVIEVAGKGT